MHFIKSVLSLLMAVVVLNSYAQVEINLNNPKTEFSILEKSPYKIKAKTSVQKIKTLPVSTVEGNFVELGITGFSPLYDAGKPQLPVYSNLIEIPYGAEIQINIISYNEQDIDLGSTGIMQKIMPSQPSVSKSADPSEIPFYYDRVAYQTNAFTQAEMVTVERSGIMRGVQFANITVAPLRYNPVTNMLKVYNDLVFEVVFKHPDIALTEQMKAKYYSPYFETSLNKMINHTAPATKDALSKYPIKYVIISLSSFESALKPFVYWKRQKGFNVIEKYYTSAPTTSTVQTYIQGLYDAGTANDPAPTFVLLVGDVAQIPTYSDNSSLGTHKTDLYYFTMDGSGDNIPDIYYGRFSATTTTHVTNQVNKTLQYEKYTMPKKTYMDTVVMVAGNDDSYDLTYGNGQINYGTTNYFNAAHGIYAHAVLGPNNTEAIAGANMRAMLYKGVGYANYTAHCGSSGWSEPGFSTTQIASMYNTDKYGLMVGNCCQSNTFNDTECFGEALLRAYPNKGAVGYIGGSNYSYWNEDYYWGVGARSSIVANPTYTASALGAYDCIFHDHGESKTSWAYTNDQMRYAGLLAVQASSSSSAYKLYYWEIYHLMGDPSVMNYFSVPDPLTVSYTSPQNVGITSLVVNTEEDALVALSTAGVLLDAELAPAGGVTTLNFNAITQPDTLDVVITKQNKQPYIGTLIVNAASIPLDAELVSINNPTGTYSCTGINVVPQVTVRNAGTNTLTSFRVTYQITGGSQQIYNWTGSLASYQTVTIDLQAVTIPAGTSSFTATTSLPNGAADQNTANDSKTKGITASNLPVSADFSASVTSSCGAPLSVNFTNNSTNTSTYLWNFGDGSTSTEANPTHSYSELGTYTVTLTASAGVCGDDLETKNAYITVGAELPVGYDESRCGPGSVTLNATGAGTLNWYDAATGGNLLTTGVSYTTPSLTSTTNYYVDQTIVPPLEYVGKVNKETAATLHTNNSYWLVFDCYSPVVLKSVKVYAGAAGNRIINLRNSSNTVIQTTTVNIPAGESRINLNFNVPVGTSLQLATGTSNPNMYRDNSGVSFPYNLAGKISITGTNAGSNLYYYYYDWEIESPSCSSARTEVTATILSAPPVAQFTYTQNGSTINFNNTSSNGVSYLWNFGDGTNSGGTNPAHTYTSAGTYDVMLIATNNCTSDTTVQQLTVVITGVEENELSKIEVFPNPAKDIININLNGVKIDKIILTDILGKEIYTISNIGDKPEMDLSALKDGVYFLRFYSDGKTLTTRLNKID
ncbi:MAG TPA: C25 family cysteine peptidase [Bacteroidales bacterium]|nr:PKD domain-containing protein [Bacteroidales bacterium]HPB24628.1 C25 family cysteine peptidase [Bacteroidales bacterium]HPI29843.1 C25 family cysteine peptidase [Bacteroidales bacterium]HQN15117.1 C25 family cysteine peptidase [Bacteroidales bacterium]HQP14851.1 C25 family cysteine peptidase [Bacteroidales bacterium]